MALTPVNILIMPRAQENNKMQYFCRCNKNVLFMKRMFVVYGEKDSGKSHTMWLLLSHLLQKGAKIIDPMYHVANPFAYEHIMESKNPLPDFRAVVDWKGKKVKCGRLFGSSLLGI